MFAAAAGVAASGVAQQAPPPAAGVDIELLADTAAVAPGVPFRLGVRLRHHDGFHSYWMAPGVVGMASRIDWQLPDGFVAGPLDWPAPEPVKMLKYKAYGYESEVVLSAVVTPPAALAPGSQVRLAAQATWMACAATCHPGTRVLTLDLPVADRPAPANQEKFAAAAAKVPATLDLAGLGATFDGTQLTITLRLPDGCKPDGLTVIPETNLYDPNTPQVLTRPADGTCKIQFEVLPLARDQVPAELSALLDLPAGWPQLHGSRFARVHLPVTRTTPDAPRATDPMK